VFGTNNKKKKEKNRKKKAKQKLTKDRNLQSEEAE
jgi:hypothetical protein